MSDHFGTLYNERWKKKEGIYYISKWSGDKLEYFKNDTVELYSIKYLHVLLHDYLFYRTIHDI